MSATVYIWSGRDLRFDGNFTLSSPAPNTPLDDNSHYEVMFTSGGGYSLQEWRDVASYGTPNWQAINSPIPASTTVSYSSEADMISQFQTLAAVPVHTMTMASNGGSSGSGGIGVYTMDINFQGLTSGKNYVIEGTFTDGVKAYEVTGTDPNYVKSVTEIPLTFATQADVDTFMSSLGQPDFMMPSGSDGSSSGGSSGSGGGSGSTSGNESVAINDVFGKVYRLESQHLDNIVESGHSLSPAMDYTFMMNDNNELIIKKVMTVAGMPQKYLPYEGSPSYSTASLKSTYNTVETLDTYIKAAASGFTEVGTMLKRVDITDSSTTINLNDPDFEETFDPASKLEVKHADKSTWRDEHVYSISEDGFGAGFPDVSGYWIADPDSGGDGVTFTKVVSDGDAGYIPDGHSIHFASNRINIDSFDLSDGTGTSNMTVQEIAQALSSNNGNPFIAYNTSYDGSYKVMPPVVDLQKTLSDGVTPIYRDENSSDLLIKIGDSFVTVRSEGITYTLTGGPKDLSALEVASIDSLQIRSSDFTDQPLADVFAKMSGVVQPINKLSVDIVIPLSDVFDYGEGYDNRNISGNQISSLAFVPDENSLNFFENIFVSFEKDIDGDLDKLSFRFADGHYVTSGSASSNPINQDYYYNLVGHFDDLMNGGELDVYLADGWNDSDMDNMFDPGEEIFNAGLGTTISEGVPVPNAYSLGTPVTSTGGPVALPGGTNGYNAGIGNDYVMMNVSAMSSYSGDYNGGAGYDYLDIKNDTGGMIVDFFAGNQGDPNSAFVTWSEGGNTGFTMSGFESLSLSNGNDIVMIGAGVGEGLTTEFDTVSFLDSQSMFRIEAGNVETDGTIAGTGTDYLYVNSDSNIYLSYENSFNGVTATFNDTSIPVHTLSEEFKGLAAGDYVFEGNNSMTVNAYAVNNGVVAPSSTPLTFSTITEADEFLSSLEYDYAIDGKQSASITGANMAGTTTQAVNTKVEETGGTGQLIDAIKTTGSADLVVNNGLTGITVNLGGTDNYPHGTDLNMYKDAFVGSELSKYDVLDAREAIDLAFSSGTFNYTNENGSHNLNTISITGTSELGSVVNAHLSEVDYIMVRDDREELAGINDDDQIWDNMSTADVDFYKDMSSLYGKYQIDGLGTITSDTYGQGYDVQTSAKLETFGTNSDLTIYYDGNHSDFVDQNDKFSGTEGVYKMTLESGMSAYSIGSEWAAQVETSTGGSVSSSFYVEVGGKKVAVSHDGTGWKVDNTALFIAQNASANINKPTDMNIFSKDIAERYNISYDHSVDGIGTFTDDIYLNATEQQINEVLASTDGLVTSTKAFNFGFYTKFQIGDALINIKLSQNDTGTQFTVNENDVDLMVENIFNRVDTTGAGISSGGKAGNFVKVDDTGDIALGNGGNDTYVIENATMGTALEYGDIDTAGGLDNSEADSINFAGVTSAADLVFTRDEIRNESEDSTLIINDGIAASNTSLFDNYNTYFDFRRIEYLTVDDAANNDEIFEISVDGNIGNDDGINNDLAWDNEIVVAHNKGDTIYADGGTDILVGGAGDDVFNLENVVGGNNHDTMSHVHIKNISASDSIVMDKTDDFSGDTENDGIVNVQKTNGTSYMLFTDDEDLLKNHLSDALL